MLKCWSNVGLGATVAYLLGLDIHIFTTVFLFTPKTAAIYIQQRMLTEMSCEQLIPGNQN